MLNDLSTEGIPVYAEKLGRLGLISPGLVKSALNEFSFEFTHSFAEVDVPFDHFGHERLQLLFHWCFLRMDFLSQLLPPPFQGTVTHEEFGLQLIRRYYGERSRARKEVRRKL